MEYTFLAIDEVHKFINKIYFDHSYQILDDQVLHTIKNSIITKFKENQVLGRLKEVPRVELEALDNLMVKVTLFDSNDMDIGHEWDKFAVNGTTSRPLIFKKSPIKKEQVHREDTMVMSKEVFDYCHSDQVSGTFMGDQIDVALMKDHKYKKSRLEEIKKALNDSSYSGKEMTLFDFIERMVDQGLE